MNESVSLELSHWRMEMQMHEVLQVEVPQKEWCYIFGN